jgi:chromosome segregation ATPase
MDKTALKIIETLKLAESPNPELALSSLRMASRLAGGSLSTWLESLASGCISARSHLDLKLENEMGTLRDEIEWLGLMLRARNEDIKHLKKEIARLKQDNGAIFDDQEPEKLEIQRLKAELKDAKQALGLLTGFVDELIQSVPKNPEPPAGADDQERALD